MTRYIRATIARGYRIGWVALVPEYDLASDLCGTRHEAEAEAVRMVEESTGESDFQVVFT